MYCTSPGEMRITMCFAQAEKAGQNPTINQLHSRVPSPALHVDANTILVKRLWLGPSLGQVLEKGGRRSSQRMISLLQCQIKPPRAVWTCPRHYGVRRDWSLNRQAAHPHQPCSSFRHSTHFESVAGSFQSGATSASILANLPASSCELFHDPSPPKESLEGYCVILLVKFSTLPYIIR